MIGGDKPSANQFSQVIAIDGFRRLWFGQLFSQLAANALLFVIGLRVYQATGSNTAVSVLFIVYGVPSLFFGVAAGSIVDKLDRKLVLFLADLVRGLILIPFIFLSNDVKSVYVFTFFFALVNQFYVPAEAPFIPLLVPQKLRVSANSLFSFTYFSSLAIGSILAGPFLRLFGARGVFVFLALLFGLASLSVYRMPVAFENSDVWKRLGRLSPWYIVRRVLANMLAGVQYVQKSKQLAESLLLLTGTQVIMAILGALGPGFADKILEIDVRDASILVTGPVVIGIIVGALWVGTVGSKIPRETLIQRGILLSGIILIVVSAAVAAVNVTFLYTIVDRGVMFPVIFGLFFMLGVANSFLDVPANTNLQEKASGDMRSRVYGIMAAAVGGLGILPVVLGGILADSLGVGKVIFILGAIIIVYGSQRMKKNGISLVTIFPFLGPKV